MSIEDKINNRIDSLLLESTHLSIAKKDGTAKTDSQFNDGLAWIVSAQHIFENLCSGISTPYADRAKAIATREFYDDYVAWDVPQSVGEMASLLRNLKEDINAGLFSSIADRTRAETFDEFLDHADHYMEQNRKNEAGAISGIVFEDTIRRICRRIGFDEKDKSLDSLISELTKRGEITSVKAKRARVAAHVRTKASHAQWDEFEATDVYATIEFTRELISSNLDK